MKDALGQPLVKGDIVAYIAAYSSELSFGTVMRFTPQNVRVMPNEPSRWSDEKEKGTLRNPSAMIKVTEQYKHFATEHPELLV